MPCPCESFDLKRETKAFDTHVACSLGFSDSYPIIFTGSSIVSRTSLSNRSTDRVSGFVNSVTVRETKEKRKKMPMTGFSGSLSSPKVDLIVDLGNPILNLTVDGFLKIGSVAAAKAAAEEVYHVVKRGNISQHKFEHSLKKMCKEGAYWGTVAGVYLGMEHGVERVRGVRDWKNAMIGGALAGAIISAASSQNRDKIVLNAITGSAVATAAEFINYFT